MTGSGWQLCGGEGPEGPQGGLQAGVQEMYALCFQQQHLATLENTGSFRALLLPCLSPLCSEIMGTLKTDHKNLAPRGGAWVGGLCQTGIRQESHS